MLLAHEISFILLLLQLSNQWWQDLIILFILCYLYILSKLLVINILFHMIRSLLLWILGIIKIIIELRYELPNSLFGVWTLIWFYLIDLNFVKMVILFYLWFVGQRIACIYLIMWLMLKFRFRCLLQTIVIVDLTVNTHYIYSILNC